MTVILKTAGMFLAACISLNAQAMEVQIIHFSDGSRIAICKRQYGGMDFTKYDSKGAVLNGGSQWDPGDYDTFVAQQKGLANRMRMEMQRAKEKVKKK